MLSESNNKALIWTAAACLLLAAGCDGDHGIAPLRSTISGTVTFLGDWPEATAQVVIVASTRFPPTAFTDLILSEPLPIGVSQYDYDLYVPPGTYQLVGVAWRGEDEAWDVNSLVGQYTQQVVVATESSQATGIDITVNFTRGTISGSVTFQGDWPENAEEVRVVVYQTYPPASFFLMSGYSDPIPLGVSAHGYTVSLAPGTYEWVIVVWRPAGKFWGPDVFPEGYLGMYTSPSDTTRPGQVVVQQAKVSAGINIAVDFAHMGEVPPEIEEILQTYSQQ